MQRPRGGPTPIDSAPPFQPVGWPGSGALLRKLAQSIPPKALLLAAGGSPCQQFSSVGAEGGRLGLAGQ
eukprot:14470952-Alexandrium_andersonii.AAC.1